MNYTYSKLYPKVKNISDDITDVVKYIQDVKPYHTKLDDVIVQYTFIENIECAIDENYNSITDFILNYHEDRDGYDVHRFDHDGYDGSQILVQEYYPIGYNEYAYDSEHFDALLTADYMVDNSPTTIKTTIKEHLVIDTSRYKLVGLDYHAFDVDNFDTVDLSELPDIKSYTQPLYLGDPDKTQTLDDWSGWDTSYFMDAFIESGLDYNAPSPMFDDDFFHAILSYNKDKPIVDVPSPFSDITFDDFFDTILTYKKLDVSEPAIIPMFDDSDFHTMLTESKPLKIPVIIDTILPEFDSFEFDHLILD